MVNQPFLGAAREWVNGSKGDLGRAPMASITGNDNMYLEKYGCVISTMFGTQ